MPAERNDSVTFAVVLFTGMLKNAFVMSQAEQMPAFELMI